METQCGGGLTWGVPRPSENAISKTRETLVAKKKGVRLGERKREIGFSKNFVILGRKLYVLGREFPSVRERKERPWLAKNRLWRMFKGR